MPSKEVGQIRFREISFQMVTNFLISLAREVPVESRGG